MLKVLEDGLYTASLTKNSAFRSEIMGTHMERDGITMFRPIMFVRVATNPGAPETFGIGTKTYTFIASGATGDQINLGIDIAATTSSIKAKINADTADTGVTAYSLSNPGILALIDNVVEDAEDAPAFTADGVKLIEDIGWDLEVGQPIVEDEDYFKVDNTTDEASLPVELVEYNPGTDKNFLY